MTSFHDDFFLVPVLDEFDNLLSKQSPLEAYTEWIDSVIERCIQKVPKPFSPPITMLSISADSGSYLSQENLEKSPLTFKIRCSNFLTHWSYLTAKILQDLTLQSAASFGESLITLTHTKDVNIADPRAEIPAKLSTRGCHTLDC